jgi:aspartate kinase
MIVMKFGGTSVGEPEAIRRVAGIIRSRLPDGPAVVVSAVAKTTDELVSFSDAASADSNRADDLIDWILERHVKLIADLDLDGDSVLSGVLSQAANDLIGLRRKFKEAGRAEPMLMDLCLSTGEFLSSNILVSYLNSQGIEAIWADAREAIVTDSRFGSARPLFSESKALASRIFEPVLKAGKVAVMQGFVGSDVRGRTTTFGRGGSDYSATFLGALLGAKTVEIWTDVDGILTADPSLVPEARRIQRMSFEEASELAYFGAKVLHPSTLRPAIERGVPVSVLNSMSPTVAGTEITPSGEKGGGEEAKVKSIAYKEGLTVLNITSTRMLMAYGFLASIFRIFNQFETPVDLVATSEVSVSVTVDTREKIDQIVSVLSEISEVEVQDGKAIVCCVGEDIGRQPGMPAQVFGELEGIRVTLISQGASRINISFVINESDLSEVVNRLHRRFFSTQSV